MRMLTIKNDLWKNLHHFSAARLPYVLVSVLL